MNIVYIENVRIPSERAHAYQIVQTCSWLGRMGHEVVLANPDRAGGKNVFAFYGIEPDLFHHVTLKCADPLSWNWFPFKKAAYVWQRYSFSKHLRTWMHDQHADLWYTRDPAMALLIGEDPHRKIVLELHDRPDAQPERWKRVKDKIAGFVVITHGLRDALISLGVDSGRIHVSPDGFDPKDFERPLSRDEARARLGLPSNAFVAMYTGSFYPWKGVELAVAAWQKTDASAHLVLIGGPDGERARIEGLIPKDAADRIHVLPRMPHAEAVRLLFAADIGLLTTSPEFSIGREFTSPIKQFEYLAAGLPVLATDVPSSHEVLDEEIAKFFAYNEKSFLKSLESARTDAIWRERAATQAKIRVGPYTWEARSASVAEFCGRVLLLQKTEKSRIASV